MQHRIWVMLQGGLYPPETEDIVQTLLSPTKDGSPRPRIVDVGSGSGIWYGGTFVFNYNRSTNIILRQPYFLFLDTSVNPPVPLFWPSNLLPFPHTHTHNNRFWTFSLTSSIRAIEMALKFPHVDVLGIDLAESKPA